MPLVGVLALAVYLLVLAAIHGQHTWQRIIGWSCVAAFFATLTLIIIFDMTQKG